MRGIISENLIFSGIIKHLCELENYEFIIVSIRNKENVPHFIKLKIFCSLSVIITFYFQKKPLQVII